MNKTNFFKKDDNIYYEDKKNLKFILVKDPNQVIDFCNIHPDEAALFVRVLPVANSESRNSLFEKKYRIFTDLNTIVHLTPETIESMSKLLIDYLLQVEDFDRLCIVRDVVAYYEFEQERKDQAIKEALKKSQKSL